MAESLTELTKVESLFFNTMPFDLTQKIKEEQESRDIEHIIAGYSKVIVIDPKDHVTSQDMPRLNFSISKLK